MWARIMMLFKDINCGYYTKKKSGLFAGTFDGQKIPLIPIVIITLLNKKFYL